MFKNENMSLNIELLFSRSNKFVFKRLLIFGKLNTLINAYHTVIFTARDFYCYTYVLACEYWVRRIIQHGNTLFKGVKI